MYWRGFHFLFGVVHPTNPHAMRERASKGYIPRRATSTKIMAIANLLSGPRIDPMIFGLSPGAPWWSRHVHQAGHN